MCDIRKKYLMSNVHRTTCLKFQVVCHCHIFNLSTLFSHFNVLFWKYGIVIVTLTEITRLGCLLPCPDSQNSTMSMTFLWPIPPVGDFLKSNFSLILYGFAWNFRLSGMSTGQPAPIFMLSEAYLVVLETRTNGQALCHMLEDSGWILS